MARFKSPFPRLSRGHPLARGLVAAYGFNEGGGSTVYDLSGNAYDLTTANSPTWGGGPTGGTLSLNGSNQNCGIASFPYSDNVTALVLASGFQSGSNATFRSIIGHAPSGAVGDWYLYWKPSDSKLHIDIPFVLGDVCVSTSTVTDLGSNYHLMGFTRSGAPGAWAYTINLDGKKIGSSTSAALPGSSSYALALGSSGKSPATLFSAASFGLGLVYNRSFDDTDWALAQAEFGV